MAPSTKANGMSNGDDDDTSNSFPVPPAYDLHRSDRINGGEHNHPNTRPPSSFATTEDSIVSSTVIDYQSTTSSPGADDEQYEGFRRVGGGRIETSIGLAVPSTPSATAANLHPDSSQLHHEQQYPHGVNGDIHDSYHPSHDNDHDTTTTAAQDATATIHKMHSKLLYLLSHPELFHDALTWEDDSLGNKFEEDSTFEGLSDTNNNNNNSSSNNNQVSNVMATQNETFEFNPNNVGGAATSADNEQNGNATNTDDENSPPLPFQIFASDAEVVLPQALTATQLFGVERETGIELEAAAGITGLSHLFLRWLALMPEGDHMNIIRPPGLTVMRIAGGGYRVTAAHRVVWRWMNKFSFVPMGPSHEEVEVDAATTSADSSDTTDFDFGDLVTMTIIDVFETDSEGKLLSYCPTFDNRAVHKTKVSVERIKKSATQFKQRMGVIAQSPAGKRVNKAAGRVGRIGMTAALRVGSMVKSKIEEMGTDEMMRRNVAREEEMKLDARLQSSSSNGGDRGRDYGRGDDDGGGSSSQKLPTRVEV